MDEYNVLYKHYESCLDKFGATNKGVDWPNEQDATIRYKVMIDIISDKDINTISLLDFGAGCAHLNDYLVQEKLSNIKYAALDISKKFCDVILTKYPNINIYNLDILNKEHFASLPKFDFIVMNGVFTEKRDLSDEKMWIFFTNVVMKTFAKCERGIAFNVMSPIVDWKDEQLFYVSYDKLGKFLKENVSRNYTFNQSYGLWEYTVYVFKNSC